MEQLEAEAEKLAEHHEAEKALLARQAEMQRQQYESTLKKVGGRAGGRQHRARAACRMSGRLAQAEACCCQAAGVGLHDWGRLS